MYRCERPCRIIERTGGQEIERPILGATALEVLGFSVDPVNEILVPTALYEFATLSA